MSEIAAVIWLLGMAWLCFSFIKAVFGFNTRVLQRRLDEIEDCAAPQGYIFRVARGEFDEELREAEYVR